MKLTKQPKSIVPHKINGAELKKQLRKTGNADLQLNGLIVKGIEQHMGLSPVQYDLDLPGGIKHVSPVFMQFLMDLNIMEVA